MTRVNIRALRVLHVINSIAAGRGGPSYIITHLCRALLDLGVDVSVLSTDADLGSDEDEVRARLAPVPLILSRAFGPAQLELSPGLLPHLLQPVDLIHIHTVFTFPVAAAAWASRARGVPYVMRPAGTLDAACLALKSTRQKQLAVAAYVRPAMERAAFVHATSESEAAELRLLAPRASVEVAEPGVALFPPGPPPAGRTIAYLGRIHPIKRLEVLIEAAALLPGVELVLAGAGDPGYVAELRRRGPFRLLGHVNEAEKAELLSRAAVLAFPSLHENFGVAVAEALAAGRPVVVSPEVGIAPSLGEAGLVVEATPRSFATALGSLLDDPEQLRVRGAAARQLAQRRFSWERAAGRVLELYQARLRSLRDGRTFAP
jgi:glycosyltransferase involved in cell wall biosynthesis